MVSGGLANTRVYRLDSGHVQIVRADKFAWRASEGLTRQGRRHQERQEAKCRRRKPFRLRVWSPEQWERRRRENDQRADRRAKATLIRLAIANGMVRMVTLTFSGEGVHDRDVALHAYARFGRWAARHRVRLIAVLQLHPKGHGYHVHVLIDRYVPQRELQDAWGRGIVHVTRIPAREGARYLAKYIVQDKQGGDGQILVERGFYEHRYHRSRGLKTWAHEDHWTATMRELIMLKRRLTEETGCQYRSPGDCWTSEGDEFAILWLHPPDQDA